MYDNIYMQDFTMDLDLEHELNQDIREKLNILNFRTNIDWKLNLELSENLYRNMKQQIYLELDDIICSEINTIINVRLL